MLSVRGRLQRGGAEIAEARADVARSLRLNVCCDHFGPLNLLQQGNGFGAANTSLPTGIHARRNHTINRSRGWTVSRTQTTMPRLGYRRRYLD